MLPSEYADRQFSVIASLALGVMHKLYEHFVFAILLLLTFGILVILVCTSALFVS